MHWGVRKGASSGVSGGGKGKGEESSDHKMVEGYKSRVSKNGTKALSNDELQKLVNRLNLEQQHSRLTSEEATKSHVDRGHDAVKKALAIGATANAAYKFSKSPVGEAGKKAAWDMALKAAKTAGKHYRDYKTAGQIATAMVIHG